MMTLIFSSLKDNICTKTRSIITQAVTLSFKIMEENQNCLK